MKMKDVMNKSPEELKKLILEREGELREFRFAQSGAGKQSLKVAKEARLIIARAKTALNQSK